MSQRRFAVLHVALNPSTGVWSALRELAAAQHASGQYAAVGLGLLGDRAWLLTHRDEAVGTGLPVFVHKVPHGPGTIIFLCQRLRRPPIEAWAAELAATSSTVSVIVHFHNAWLSGVFLPLRKIPPYRMVSVATFHGVNVHLRRWLVRRAIHRWIARRLVRYGARLTSVSAAALGDAERILGLKASDFVVVPNGTRRRERRTPLWHGPPRELRLGHVGSLYPDKGGRLAVEAGLRARSHGWKVRVVIAGEGPEASEIRRRAMENPEVLEYLGYVPQAADEVIPTLDALVLLSVQEGLPMAAIEAMSAGVPIVATSVGGLPELVADGETGVLIPRTVEALVDVIAAWHAEPAQLARLAEQTQRRFETLFALDRVIERYRGVYEQALKCSAVPNSPHSSGVMQGQPLAPSLGTVLGAPPERPADGFDFAILIPTRNRPVLLAESLRRLAAAGFQECPLWIYDDASVHPEAVRKAVATWPRAQVIRGEKRIGQAAGRNRLMRACGRTFAIFLDDDQYFLTKGPIFEYMLLPPDVRPPAVVAFQSINRGDGRCAIRRGLPVGETWTFMGGACLFHVPSVLAVGGFREDFMYGWEEPELAMRLWLRGFQLWFDTRIVVEHNHRVTPETARDAAEYDFLYARNIVLAYTLNAPAWIGWPLGVVHALRFVRRRDVAARDIAMRGVRVGLRESLRRRGERTPASTVRFCRWLRYVRRCSRM